MLWSLISIVVGTLVGALVLKFAVWVVASRAPNGLLRAVAVNFAMAIAVFLAALLGAGLTVIGGFVGAVAMLILVILAPIVVLRAAYGIGTLRALVLVLVLGLCHLAMNHVMARVSGRGQPTLFGRRY